MKQTIELRGPKANAFYLLALAEQYGKALEMEESERKEIREKMMSGDYENLLSVFNENFGHLVEFV